MKRHHATALLLLILAAMVCYFAGRDFLNMHEEEAIYPSPHLTVKKRLSDYFPGLKNSPGDSSVYIFEGQKEGGSLLILGGTHPNEPAGFITAVILVENIKVNQGKVIIVPRANKENLMLKKEVIDAVKRKKFHIYQVSRVEEGIQILTGVKAGKRDKKGTFPEGTVYGAVQKKLKEYYKRSAALKKELEAEKN